MRVLIDATSLLLRSAGIKTYTYFWLEHLRRQRGRDTVDAFPFLGQLGRLDHDASNLSRASTLPRLAALYLANVPANPFIDVATARADVFHASNQVRVAPRRTALTATVHDLTCWLMPELHTEANVRADKSFAARILSKARGLIAVSEHTRQDVIRLLGVAPERVVTIHSGVADAFFDAAPTPASKPYVLFVGTIEPRKNLDTLLDAWQALPRDLRGAFDLRVCGPAGWRSESTMRRLRGGVEGVEYLGYVAEAALPGLTAAATAFVYPSLYEGFGFPVAQAMAARVPVITSNVSSLPEVAGDGALLVDPRSSAELTRALRRVLEEPALRETLGQAGRARAEQYRWAETARRSWQFFRNL
jgi:alpha-1,3-rhamnosyl/mannosyltransferase